LIESALGRPYSGYYRRIWQKAAALVQSMAGNHGFADGNKRTTLILLHTFISNSGYRLVPVADEDIEDVIENVILKAARNAISVADLSVWFEARLKPVR
jgi:death on curing protein